MNEYDYLFYPEQYYEGDSGVFDYGAYNDLDWGYGTGNTPTYAGDGGFNWGSLGSAVGGALSNPSVQAALGGGLLSMMGPSQVGTQTTTSAPWEAQQPYLRSLFAGASNALGGAAQMSPEEQIALDAMSQRAISGSPLTQLGQGTAYGVMAGMDSNPTMGLNNPYLSDAIGAAQKDVTDAYNLGTKADLSRAASQAGAFGLGNSAFDQLQARNQEGLARQLGNVSTNMRMADYGNQQQLFENDINRRLNVAQMSPQFANQDYTDLQKLYDVGQTYRYDQFNPLAKYGSLIQGQYGNVNSTPLYQNKAQDFLGGALATMQIGQKSGLLG